MAGITLMFIILFRNITLSLIGVVPNFMAAFLILGIIGLLEIPLDMMTITIAAITIGIAVDNSIHYIYRFKEEFKNCEVISDEKIKSHVLKESTFAVAKSGTISLEICNAKVPSVIIYKMNKINFFIIKMLVKVKSPNIINIAADEEVIPELLQSKCNSKDIYKMVDKLLSDKQILEKQVTKSQEIINKFKNAKSSEVASSVLLNQL